MDSSVLTSVSHCGNYLACVTSDGQVHFWDTLSSNLLSRFSFHRHSEDLSLQCVNIRWLHTSDTFVQNESPDEEPPKKKVKHDDSTGLHITRREKLAALGTSDGTIWIYNFIKQRLHTQLSPLAGHGSLLNFDYETAQKRFFLLFSKSYLSQIDFAGKELKSFELDKNDFKFTKNDHQPIVNVVDEDTVLIGKNILALIDWKSLEVITRFTGSNSKIAVCQVVRTSGRSLLFTGSENERTIFVYDIAKPEEQFCFLSLDDSPTYLQAILGEDSKLTALVTTTSGDLLVFQEDLSDMKKLKTNLFRRKYCLSVSVEPRVRFGFARLNFDVDGNKIIYGFGSATNPNFDSLTMKQAKKVFFDRGGALRGAVVKKLKKEKDDKKDKKPTEKTAEKAAESKKEEPKKQLSKKEKKAAERERKAKEREEAEKEKEKEKEKKVTIVQENVQKSKFEAPKPNNKVQVLGPALPSCEPLPSFEKDFKLPKKEPKTKEEMSLEMRLQLEERGLTDFLRDQEKEHEREEKKIYRKRMHGVANKLVTALEQGLQNDNSNMLMTALLCPDKRTVKNTIAGLKYQTIVPLLNKLQVLAHSSDGHQDVYYNWLTMITKMKLSYFLQLPEKEKLFRPLFKFLEFKQNSFHKMSVLHGRLQVMMDSMKELNKPVKEALIRYETDSSDDENDIVTL